MATWLDGYPKQNEDGHETVVSPPRTPKYGPDSSGSSVSGRPNGSQP